VLADFRGETLYTSCFTNKFTQISKGETVMKLPLRLLGIITIICAPMMTIEAARHGFQPVPNEQTDVIGALLYALFSIGWLAGMIGLWQLRATGKSLFGRIILAVTLVTISLAILQSLVDILKVDTSNPFYMVTDIAWPLSMLLTFIIGVAVVVAKRLPGWKRFVPLYTGIGVPLALLSIALGFGMPMWYFDFHTITGWLLLGYVVFSEADKVTKRSIALAA
jgi:hypothetical protein